MAVANFENNLDQFGISDDQPVRKADPNELQVETRLHPETYYVKGFMMLISKHELQALVYSRGSFSDHKL